MTRRFGQVDCPSSDTLSVQMTSLSAYMYRQNSQKALWGAIAPCPPPPPGYASGVHSISNVIASADAHSFRPRSLADYND